MSVFFLRGASEGGKVNNLNFEISSCYKVKCFEISSCYKSSFAYFLIQFTIIMDPMPNKDSHPLFVSINLLNP